MTDSAKIHSTGTNQNPPAPSNGGVGGDLGGHIAKLEARMDYLATKEDVAKLEAEMKHFATKEDVAKLEAEMKHFATKEDVAKLEAEMKHLATKEDMQSVRADMQSMKNDLMRWHLIVMSVGLAALGVFLRYFN